MVERSESIKLDPPLVAHKSISVDELVGKLPIRLCKLETISPAPSCDTFTIDWLPDFNGYAWIAYGASSCLVISHFPSPLSPHETAIGPIFRQVFEFSSVVSAVAWSPTTLSSGDLAAASENCICLFCHDSVCSHGSFCWSQTTTLVQSAKVEALAWTGSGDGIVACGIEVVLWRENDCSWEQSWKFRAEFPQTLVSSTWSIEGPSATAAHVSKLHVQEPFSQINEAIKYVLVCHSDGNATYLNAVLRHPQPVSFIQWRPLTGRCIDGVARQVLITCCFDGVVRLWSEYDNGKVRKIGKDDHDLKAESGRLSFCVTAVIEINQVMNGILGSDVFVTWATDLHGIIPSVGTRQDSSVGVRHLDKSSDCEWLIALGPGTLLTFWAVHCIDDIFPVRFPRVTLWKQQKLRSYDESKINSTEQSLINKVVISRNQFFGPPMLCSLIRVYPSNSLNWPVLYTQMSSDTEDELTSKSSSDSFFSCCVDGFLCIEGHRGYILQVEVHPCGFDVRLAASLDSNGIILFWTVSSACSQIVAPSQIPIWRYRGQFTHLDVSTKYSSLKWEHSLLREDPVLLLGHPGGIDCIVVKVPQCKEEVIACHNLFTISYKSECVNSYEPADIFSIPLPSVCSKTCDSINFLILGIWKNEFQALSWNVTIHAFGLHEKGYRCGFNSDSANSEFLRYEKLFSGNRYNIIIKFFSLQFPYPHCTDPVSSYSVIYPAYFISGAQKNHVSLNSLPCHYPSYHIATGCSNGRLKLWRINPVMAATPDLCWELVGVLSSNYGPISAISISNCGQKIATIHPRKLCIWDLVHVAGSGSFMLEDCLSLDGVVALNWLALENRKFLLGVCMFKELRIYAAKRIGGLTPLNSEKFSEMHIWYTIAVTCTINPICGFFWGPMATPVVIHGNYLSIFGQWLLFADVEHEVNCHPKSTKNMIGTDSDFILPVFFDGDSNLYKKFVMVDSMNGRKSGSSVMNKMKFHLSSNCFAKYGLWSKHGFWSMLDVGEKLFGSLPVYHPEALLINICSGNWKRAYLAVRHLVEFLKSNDNYKKSYSSENCCIVPQLQLSSYLELIPKSCTEGGTQWSAITQIGYNSESDNSYHMSSLSLTKSEISGFVEPLEKLYHSVNISNAEKVQIIAIVDLLDEVSNLHAYKSLDESGRRFWVSVRFQQLYFHRRFGRLASLEDIVVGSDLIGWALHSDCQEILFGLILPIEPSWHQMKSLSVGFWFTNAMQLRVRMEKLARTQYLKHRDPRACALLYVALNRVQVLAGLFKVSRDEKDKPIVGFLSRNFQEEENKAAALKNAYVLMGRHQLELAGAFFLLGGDASSAVTVCAKNLGDQQLALVICRLVEGYGGPLERHLILNNLLPLAVQNGDYWLASHLEWILGNYSQSFLSMFSFQMGSEISHPIFASIHSASLDPCLGQYCLKLSNTSNMRNTIGEHNSVMLSKWSNLMTAISLYRRGLPLESLECFSSSLATFESIRDQKFESDDENSEFLTRIFMPNSNAFSNWLSGDVALNLESNAKLGLAMQCLSRSMREHPHWVERIISYNKVNTSFRVPKIDQMDQYEMKLENFQFKLFQEIEVFEQKFSVVPSSLINLIIVWFYNNGLFTIGYDLLHHNVSQNQSQNINSDRFAVAYPILPKLYLEATVEIACLLSRFSVVCCMSSFQPRDDSIAASSSDEFNSSWLSGWDVYMQCHSILLLRLKCLLHIIAVSSSENFLKWCFLTLDLFDCLVDFVFAWLQRNIKCLVLMVETLLIKCNDKRTLYDVDMENLNKLLEFAHNMLTKHVQSPTWIQSKQGGSVMSSIPEEEKWQIVLVCLWQHMSCFLKRRLDLIFDNLGELYSRESSSCRISSFLSFECFDPDRDDLNDPIKMVLVVLAKTLNFTVTHLSSHRVRQFTSLLLLKVEYNLDVPTLKWLEKACNTQQKNVNNHLKQADFNLDMTNCNKDSSISEISWEFFADPKLLMDGFEQAKINWLDFIKHKPFKKWNDFSQGLMENYTSEKNNDEEGKFGVNLATKGLESHARRGLFGNGFSFLTSWKKEPSFKIDVISFQNAKDIYKKSGDLLEALCINSIDQQQVALSGNQKGIIFLNWEPSLPFINHSDYIWSEADWPQNGWAGLDSTPVPTCVSPGVGLGSKRGAHLGLGGATIGNGSLVRPGGELNSGGKFGHSSYTGAGSSGLGWEIQDDFEELIDPPATVDNVSTRALSTHPSRPFFLVGSSNTHTYLWEFGKLSATATYGVLPAANVPPPYALGSISSLQFDQFGHRFATAASDGTVCTWQLEVGGRSNVRPIESSLCFNNHASDITYISSSGSIIAVAGYNSNGANVVIWDTLAPNNTSRPSIMCHEGGTRSLAVFDNDIGSGSVSSIIVSGGKSGDVALHDFRYISTGKSRGQMPTAAVYNKSGDLNSNGILWYIPKAHQGSVTRIRTIPKTSLFLSGSKDGDVKLWDAKRARLVFHWPKLHERHTFLQPRSRGYSGIVRAGVTDLQVISNGFVSCGGDGSMKLILLPDHK